jgi:hypothetical protein
MRRTRHSVQNRRFFSLRRISERFATATRRALSEKLGPGEIVAPPGEIVAPPVENPAHIVNLMDTLKQRLLGRGSGA